MKIAVAQISCSLGDPDANLLKVRDFSRRAKEAGAELVVFPEMTDTGYSMRVIRTHANHWNGGFVSKLQEIARKLSIAIVSATQVKVAPNLRSLFRYLIDNQYVQEITDYHREYLRIHPPEVLTKLQSGDSNWEQMVPPEVVHMIKKRQFFGYRRPIAA